MAGAKGGAKGAKTASKNNPTSRGSQVNHLLLTYLKP